MELVEANLLFLLRSWPDPGEIQPFGSGSCLGKHVGKQFGNVRCNKDGTMVVEHPLEILELGCWGILSPHVLLALDLRLVWWLHLSSLCRCRHGAV